MKVLCKALLVTALTLSASSFAAELTLKTDTGFGLKTDFYQSDKNSERAVLMLHQCNYNRTMYDNIGQQLAEQGIHALSMDFRGFGESVNDEFNVDKLSSLPQEKRRSAWQKMSANWPKDVQQAYDFLKSKMSGKGVVGVIGASCGGSQAITLAENNPVKAMSFFSSGQREQNIARYKKTLAAKPTLIIAAEGDGNTFVSAKTLFETTTNEKSQFISYKGSDHGYPLLAKDKQLTKTIVGWFSNNL